MASDQAVQDLHSAVRWGKPVADIEPLCTADTVNAHDSKNGNQALHIAAQNGHLELTKWLVEKKGADVNGQNKKGQTALHMSAGYDIYEQTQWLLDHGADKTIANGDGHAAITGIDGDKVGIDAYPGPMSKLNQASSKEDLDRAYEAFEEFFNANDPAGLGNAGDLKVTLAKTGMARKKELKDIWDAPRWMAIVQKL